ncbi:uncharacterized protein LOC124256085 [Haliotis rubra]|uniref:uncharacterized protein LOC124256085 n=1 Tax=Haliotis rubra TaxID=36100 RepID=UPI001EE5B8DB|nr:uncharacterized protein LOC124256085 [Haliotis rubra]
MLAKLTLPGNKIRDLTLQIIMFMTPVISGSSRVSNDTFGLMPLNALNGSDSTFPVCSDTSSGIVPPSYEEAMTSVLCGSLAFDVQRDSRNPSPTTPRSRKLDSSPRSFKMSPTPSRVAPVTQRDDVMICLSHEYHEISPLHSSPIPHIQNDKGHRHSRSPQLQRSNSDPPPAYDDVVNIPRDATSCPSFQRSRSVDYSVGSGNISIISATGVNGVVLSEIEESLQTKRQKKKRMHHMMCGCVMVALVVVIPVLIVLMTSGTLLSNNGKGHTAQTTTQPTKAEHHERLVRSILSTQIDLTLRTDELKDTGALGLRKERSANQGQLSSVKVT